MDGHPDTASWGDKDEFSYLEDSTSKRTQEWVKTRSDQALKELESDPRFNKYYQSLLQSTSYASRDKELTVKVGRTWLNHDWLYQLHSDAEHPRGIFRRTPLQPFLEGKASWQDLIDVDALSRGERESWVFRGCEFSPSGRRCLVELTRDGATSEWREFDLEKRAFVVNGFYVPETWGGSVVWRNEDTVAASANFGFGTVTANNNTLVVKQWSRGQPISEAKEVFRGKADDVAVVLSRGILEGTGELLISRMDRNRVTSFWQLDGNDNLQRITLPPDATDARIWRWKDQYIIKIAGDWEIGDRTWKAGSILAIPVSEITKTVPSISLIKEPDDESYLLDLVKTKDGVLFTNQRVGNSHLWRAVFTKKEWSVEPVSLPDYGTLTIVAVDPSDSGSSTAFYKYESFLQPPSTYLIDVKNARATLFERGTTGFDTNRFLVEQLSAKSSDGTLVPYYLVRSKDYCFDGSAPVLMQAYGSRGVAFPPFYSDVLGKLWLEKGGFFVLAGVRGGSERGPSWWVTGAEREHTYADAIAVAEDLIRRKVTAPKLIGFDGYSAGGLLGGVLMTQRPDLFGAVVLRAAILDNFRLDMTSSGAKFWVHEFGSPDIPQERRFLERTSPFQNLKPQLGFPKPLFITSTTDRTVYPAHSRRFAAKMESLGMAFLLIEFLDGGHGFGSTQQEAMRIEALVYTYLARQLIRSDHRNNGGG